MDTEPEFEDPGSTRIPYRSVRFMAQSGKMAAKMGVRKGVREAAKKANPALMVIDAAISVVDCVKSFIELSKAREIRDNLRRENKLLIDKLEAQREELESNIEVAREKVEAYADRQEVIAELVRECQQIFSQSMEAFTQIRGESLPDLHQLEKQEKQLLNDWKALKDALKLYQEQI